MSRVTQLADYLEHEFTSTEDREQIAAILRDADELIAAARVFRMENWGQDVLEGVAANDKRSSVGGGLIGITVTAKDLLRVRAAIAKIEAHK